MKKAYLILVLLLLLLPISMAEDCGLTNLASCIPEKIFEYLQNIINAPLQPLLGLIKDLMSEPVNIEAFISLWAIVIYIISIFYGLFLMLAGFNFIISGYSASKRETAKEWLKEVILMIIFVQASYYIYSILIELSSSMTAGVINSVDPNFFLLSIDNLPNLGLQLVFGAFYLITLFTTVILLALRYLLVALGVIFFPIGLFLNFIPPLKSYGRLIINVLGIMLFIPFFLTLIILASAKLVDIPLFSNFKILVMIAAFTLVNTTMIVLALFAAVKASLSVIKSDVGRAVTTVVTGIPAIAGSSAGDNKQKKLSDF